MPLITLSLQQLQGGHSSTNHAQLQLHVITPSVCFDSATALFYYYCILETGDTLLLLLIPLLLILLLLLYCYFYYNNYYFYYYKLETIKGHSGQGSEHTGVADKTIKRQLARSLDSWT